MREVAPFILNDETVRSTAVRGGRVHVLSSGMMIPRTLSNVFARRMIENPQHSIFFVGYAIQSRPLAFCRRRARAANLRSIQISPATHPLQHRTVPVQRSRHTRVASGFCQKDLAEKSSSHPRRPSSGRVDAEHSIDRTFPLRSNCPYTGCGAGVVAGALDRRYNAHENCLLEHQFVAKRQDRLFAWLEATQPDIVCLQETKCPDNQFPALALQAAGYRTAYHGEKSYNGVAILAKNELHAIQASLCDEVVDPQARVIAANVSQSRIFFNLRAKWTGSWLTGVRIQTTVVSAVQRLHYETKVLRPRCVRRFQCRSGGH